HTWLFAFISYALLPEILYSTRIGSYFCLTLLRSNASFWKHINKGCSNTTPQVALSICHFRLEVRRSTRVLSLEDRIKLLEDDLKLQPPAFIMARELPFAIFRYDPASGDESEWKMRSEAHKLATRVE